MQLAATRIITDDVDGLVAFYEAVTGITAERLHPMFAELRTASGTLAIASSATVSVARTQCRRGSCQPQHRLGLPRRRCRRDLQRASGRDRSVRE